MISELLAKSGAAGEKVSGEKGSDCLVTRFAARKSQVHSGGVRQERSMKESDILLSRAEKLRRDARCVRKEATRLSLATDQQRMMDVANSLEADARDLEGRARRRASQLEALPLCRDHCEDPGYPSRAADA